MSARAKIIIFRKLLNSAYLLLDTSRTIFKSNAAAHRYQIYTLYFLVLCPQELNITTHLNSYAENQTNPKSLQLLPVNVCSPEM